MDAIKQEKLAEAREILTRLLRTDQQNVGYWLWLSAAMETPKERLYCLQTAYKVDPTDASVRRGLTLLGALPPDDSIAPFPMNHSRAWEANLLLADEKPQPKGLKRLTSNPGFRMAAILGAGALALVGMAIGVGMLFSGNTERQAAPVGLTTPRPTVTPQTNPNAISQSKPTLLPLAQQLDATYTPTVVYAATQHVGAAQDSYRGGIRAFNSGQWEMAAVMMEQVATMEPGAVDALYFAGEARRLSGKYADAIKYYNMAISTSPNYAPSYLGRARAVQASSRKDTLADLDKAIDLDPNFAEAYLERALYYSRKSNYEAALADANASDDIRPGSPLTKLALARIYLGMDEPAEALIAAQAANDLDVTMLETYLVLGTAYRANGELDKAVGLMETYVQYQPDSAEAFMVLGAAYFSRQEYETAQKHLEQALRLDKTNSEAYFWMGELQMLKENYDLALSNFEKAVSYNSESFRNAEGLARAYLATEEYGQAYITISKVEKMAANDREKGEFYYIQAIANQKLSAPSAALKAWNALLVLPEDVVPAERRAEAEEQVGLLGTPTRVPATVTSTPTPSKTPLPTATRQPSRTPSPTNTRAPSATP